MRVRQLGRGENDGQEGAVVVKPSGRRDYTLGMTKARELEAEGQCAMGKASVRRSWLSAGREICEL